MSIPELDKDYWDARYREQETGWDIGYPSTPLKEYIDQLTDKSLKILVPGSGNAYEAEYLWQKGFKETYVLDISPTALEQFHQRFPDFPESHLLNEDFFKHEGQYDLILEQTFFCALNPGLRADYVKHMHALLKPGGKLAGLLFSVPLNADRPPFGGSADEYRALLSPYFHQEVFAAAHNSIKPREGKEIFMINRKK